MFCMNGSWYFATREGEQGPYPSEQQAQMEIVRFIAEKTELAGFQKAREASHACLGNAQTLELVQLDDRPRIRPSEPQLLKREVHI